MDNLHFGINYGVEWKMVLRFTKFLVVLAVAACWMPASGYQVQTPEVSVLSPQGIRFAYPGEILFLSKSSKFRSKVISEFNLW